MDIQKMIDDYLSWLRSEITFEKIGEYYEITAPYLDSANDYMQIYVKQDGDEIYFSDDCAVIHGLKAQGFQITGNRKVYLQRILLQYGVQLNGDELVAKASVEGFTKKKHLFFQAMMRIDDMFVMSQSKMPSFFLDDIHEFFEAKEIYCSENVQFKGISGFDHSYDFLLQRSKTKPERLCQALNNPSKPNMGNVLFSWNDIKPNRANGSQLIVILNDKNGIAAGVEDAFLNYEAKVIKWSERNKESNIELLSAS